jgi:predicted RNase H-like nuclease
MTSILGIDAAWSDHNPSGVALVAKQEEGTWRCLAVAPSYASFLRLADGKPVEWSARPAGEVPDVGGLFGAAARLLDMAGLVAGKAFGKRRPYEMGKAPRGGDVDLVTIDMPVSREIITGRRPADNAVTSAFGAAGCGTHSPSALRPGPMGADMTAALCRAGYPVGTAADPCATPLRTLEVYPHPALLRLTGATRRLEYKTSRAGKYWPGAGVRERIGRLLDVYARILDALGREIADVRLQLPSAVSCPSLSYLKRYEDALDALVCAWIGCRYMEGRARAYGDSTAAVWVPE